MGPSGGWDQSSQAGLHPISSTNSIASGTTKPISILNNRYNSNDKIIVPVKEQSSETPYRNEHCESEKHFDESPRAPLRNTSSRDSIPKYSSFDKYKSTSSSSNNTSGTERKLKIVTDDFEKNHLKGQGGSCSSPPSGSASCSAVSFTVPNEAKMPHHRYSISAKPGKSSQNTSPNGSSEQLSSKDSPSEEKNSIVHMPGDFIYFEPKQKNPALSNIHSQATTPLPKKEVIKPFTGPQIPFTEFFQKEDDNKLHILIGASGSVATIKVPLIIDKLFKIYTPEKVSIQLLVTKPAEHFLKGLKISTHVKIWREEDAWFGFKKLGDPVLHHELRKWADIFLIAPLSANTLAKLAYGICDNLLTSVLRDWTPTTPVLVAPAMNTFMYINPMTKTHLKILQEDTPYITVLKPVEKVLICGDIGMGGMREWSDIVEILRRKISEIRKPEDNSDDDDADEDEDEDEEEDEVDEVATNNEDEDEDDDDEDEDDDDDEEDDDEDDDDEEQPHDKITSVEEIQSKNNSV